MAATTPTRRAQRAEAKAVADQLATHLPDILTLIIEILRAAEENLSAATKGRLGRLNAGIAHHVVRNGRKSLEAALPTIAEAVTAIRAALQKES